MANVKFHHTSTQFLFQTKDGITLNIPAGQEVVMLEETAKFIMDQIKSGGSSYTSTELPISETFEVPESKITQEILVPLPDEAPKRSHKKKA